MRTEIAGGPPKESLYATLFKNVRIYTLVMVVQRAISIVMLPLNTRYLSGKDYGILELLDMLPNIVGLLLGMKLSVALSYFYHQAETEQERRRYVSTSMTAAGILGALVGIVGLYASPMLSRLLFDTTAYERFVRLTFVSFAATFTIEVGINYLRVQNRSKEFAVAQLLRIAASVALNILFLVVFRMGLSSLLWSSVITAWGLALYFALLTWRETPVRPSIRLFLQMAGYSLPLAVAWLGEFLLNFGDRAFLKDRISLTELGIYGLAYKLGMIIQFVTTPFFTYWNSQMVAVVKQPQGVHLYARMATYLLFVLTLAALGLTAFARPMVTILAAPEFRGAAAYIPWIAVAYMIRGIGSYWANTFLLDRRSGLMAATTWSGCVACLIGYAILIPPYGAWGAVASTIIGFSVMGGIAFFMGQKLRAFPYEYGRWAKLVLSAVVAAVPAMTLRTGNLWGDIAFGTASIGLFFALLFAARFPTRGEMDAISGAVGRLVGRFSGKA